MYVWKNNYASLFFSASLYIQNHHKNILLWTHTYTVTIIYNNNLNIFSKIFIVYSKYMLPYKALFYYQRINLHKNQYSVNAEQIPPTCKLRKDGIKSKNLWSINSRLEWNICEFYHFLGFDTGVAKTEPV